MRQNATNVSGHKLMTGFQSAAVLALCAGTALAGPEGARVVRGNATIERLGSQTLIRAGNNAIINYNSFNIAASESVRFVQPSASSRVLNRITDARPTRIDGALSANGRVYMVNPAGIVFGRGATVNVGGLFAAAGRMSDADFLSRTDRVTGLGSSVINEGTISVGPGGSVTLAGTGVENSGRIDAPQGTVVFAAGDEVIVTNRDSTIQVRVSGNAHGTPDHAAIENSGHVTAQRGKAVMLAGDVYGMAMRSTGTVRAQSINMQGSGRGDVIVQGSLDASNQRDIITPGIAGRTNTTTAGGDITISGERVGLFGASLNASGQSDGGTVRVGGDVRGEGSLRNATATAINDATSIQANAIDRGDGGSVVLFAQDTLRTHAGVSATGGARGGDGGFVETSGKQFLEVDGSRIDAKANAGGASGEWLIDPRNVTINNGSTANGAFNGQTPDVFTPTGDSSTIVANDIASRLSSGTSVTINTGGGGTQPGNILVIADILANTASGSSPTLSLEAASHITLSADIRQVGAGELNVNLLSNRGDANDPNPDRGSIRVNPGATIQTNGGDIVLSGGQSPTAALPDPITDPTGYLNALSANAARGLGANIDGIVIDAANLDAAGGAITLRGVGVFDSAAARGVVIANGSTVTGASIAIDGLGGPSTAAGFVDDKSGVEITDAGTLITATGAGGVTIRGMGGLTDNGNNNAGVVIRAGVQSTGSGPISIIGVSATGTGTGNAGVRLRTADADVRSTTGDISIRGNARATGNDSDGVELQSGARVRSLGAADITITGTASNSASSAIAGGTAPTNTIGDGAMTGDVTLIGNTMSLAQTDLVGAGNLFIRTFDASATIGLGTGAGTLQLDNAELSRIGSFATATIGSAQAGLMTADADLSGAGAPIVLQGTSFAAALLNGPSGNPLTLNFSANASQTGAITAGALLLTGAGSYNLTNDNNAVGTLAGNATGAMNFTNNGDLSIGTVATVVGLTSAANSEIVSRTGEINAGDVLTVSANTLTLTAREIDLNANATGAGTLSLQPFDAAAPILVGGAGPTGAGNLDITAGDLSNINAALGNLVIGRTAGTGTLTITDALTLLTPTTFRTGNTGLIALNASVASAGKAINFDGPVSLRTNALVDATNAGASPTGGSVRFASAVNADDAAMNRTLSVRGPAGVVFGGDVGQTTQLSQVTVTEGATTLTGVVRTNGQQSYAGPVRLAANTSVFASGVNFAGTIDSDMAATPRSLTVSVGAGVATFAQAMGPSAALLTTTVTSGAITLGDVTTTGNQRYEGPVTLGGTLTNTTGGSIVLTNRLDISSDSAILTAGASDADDIIIDGAINSLTAPHDLELQSGAGEVSLAQDLGLDISGGRQAIKNFTAGGANVALRNTRTTQSQVIDGRAALNGDLSVTGTGIILFSGPVTLQANSLLTTTLGSVTFGGTVDSDSAARTLTVNTGGNFETSFTSAVGGTNRLAAITTNADGTTRLSGLVRTTGDQVYNDDVIIDEATTLEVNDVVFAKTLNSNLATVTNALTVNSATVGSDAGETTFGGAVGNTRRLGLITTNAEGVTRINGNITSTGTSFGDGVQLLQNVTMDVGTGSALFRSTIDAESTTTDPTLTLVSSATGDVDNVPFKFGGNIGVTRRLGGITIGADRSTVPLASTIAFSDAFNEAGRILQSGVANTDTFRVVVGAGGFTVGARQKLIAMGTINIQSSGAVALSDMNALGNIIVDGSAIAIRRRTSGSIQDTVFQNPDRLLRDGGADLIAGGNIDFTRTPTLSGTGNAPVFSAGSGVIDPQLSGFNFKQRLNAVDVTDFRDPRTGNTGQLLALDLTSFAPSGVTITSSAFSNQAASQRLFGAASATLPAGDSQPLAELGIATRSLTDEELLDSVRNGRVSLSDLPAGLGAGDKGEGIAAARVSLHSAADALAAQRLFLSAQVVDGDGNPALDEAGNARWFDQSDQLREMLSAGWTRYTDASPKPSGAGWRMWLESFGTTGPEEEFAVLDTLDRGREAVRAYQNLGLSDGELMGPLRAMLEKVRPQALPMDQFEQAVTGLLPVALSSAQ